MSARLHGNLQADVTSFVGRERELARVRRLLSTGRVVTLTGPGGVGKTRLARRAAAQAHRAFPDGVWLVQLAQLRDRDLLAVEVATTLGIEDGGSEPVENLVRHLQDKTLLIVLDNCEHLVDSVAALLGTLLAAAPTVRVLATSRQTLGVEGEYLFEVPALSLPTRSGSARTERVGVTCEAVELFLERAAAVLADRPEDEAFQRCAEELCRRLDGIPLAIELAAARLRAYPVEEILARIGRALDVLTTGPRSAPERHRTLKTTIGWSFDLCSLDERLMWARLSVFAGGFDLAAAESVCSDDQLPQSVVFDLLAGLVDKSILQRKNGSARFSLLETVREYGLEHLVALGEEKELRRWHAGYFAALADRGGRGFSEREIEWFQQIGLNHANFRLAMQACLSELGEPRVALRIASRLRMYWASPSRILEGCQWLRKALANSPQPSEERAEALWVCAYLELLMFDTQSAARSMAECRELAGMLSLDRVVAALPLLLVHENFIAGDATAALTHAREAVVCGRAVGEPGITGEALFYVAAMAFASGDAEAEKLADEALTFFEGEKAQPWRANVLWINGLVNCRRGEPDTAAACFADAFAVFRHIGHGLGAAVCLDGLAWASMLSEELPRAARLLGMAHPIWQSGPSRMMPHQFSELVARRTVEATVRADLGDERFEEEFWSGASRTLEDAMDEITRAPGPKPASTVAESGEDSLALLTRRERKVAELLAKGMSNADIAADLVLSRRTVESHVQNILNKLGFHSRTQVASWISRLAPGG
ncbi:hypothetical protein AQI96_37355 [Streptomyces canus]|nr:hypothetical protein AQI96_37355 [Streptomyces canus]